MENPWDIQSIYDLQYFNCPSCVFKNHSKQKLINHAYDFHPESIEYLKNLNDESLIDTVFPWKHEPKIVIKTEQQSELHKAEDKNIKLVEKFDNIKIEKVYNESIINEAFENKVVQKGDKDNKCEKCGKVFSVLNVLKRHIKDVHEGQKDHKCETCCKAFSNSRSLNSRSDSRCVR